MYGYLLTILLMKLHFAFLQSLSGHPLQLTAMLLFAKRAIIIINKNNKFIRICPIKINLPIFTWTILDILRFVISPVTVKYAPTITKIIDTNIPRMVRTFVNNELISVFALSTSAFASLNSVFAVLKSVRVVSKSVLIISNSLLN